MLGRIIPLETLVSSIYTQINKIQQKYIYNNFPLTSRKRFVICLIRIFLITRKQNILSEEKYRLIWEKNYLPINYYFKNVLFMRILCQLTKALRNCMIWLPGALNIQLINQNDWFTIHSIILLSFFLISLTSYKVTIRIVEYSWYFTENTDHN